MTDHIKDIKAKIDIKTDLIIVSKFDACKCPFDLLDPLYVAVKNFAFNRFLCSFFSLVYSTDTPPPPYSLLAMERLKPEGKHF